MTKAHLKRIKMPWFWQVDRKGKKFVTRPCPGPHKLDSCMTVDMLLKEYLKYAKVRKEVKYIINNKELMIDKRYVKDYKFPVGLMDIIDLVNLKEAYRVMLAPKGKFRLIKLKKDDANLKFCKIINKTTIKKGKTQLNLFDGQNIIVEKDSYKVGDTVVLDLSEKKIKKHLKLEKGAMVLLTAGKHIGEVGVIESISQYDGMRKSSVILKSKDASFETLKEYCYVIDKDLKVEDERNKD